MNSYCESAESVEQAPGKSKEILTLSHITACDVRVSQCSRDSYGRTRWIAYSKAHDSIFLSFFGRFSVYCLKEGRFVFTHKARAAIQGDKKGEPIILWSAWVSLYSSSRFQLLASSYYSTLRAGILAVWPSMSVWCIKRAKNIIVKNFSGNSFASQKMVWTQQIGLANSFHCQCIQSNQMS